MTGIAERIDTCATDTTLLDRLGVNVMICDQNLTVSYVNPAGKQALTALEEVLTDVLGRSARDIIGVNASRILDDPAATMSLLNSLDDQPHRAEINLGERVFFINASALHDTHGKLSGVMLTWDDITNQVSREDGDSPAQVEAILTKIKSTVRGDILDAKNATQGSPLEELDRGVDHLIGWLQETSSKIEEISTQLGSRATSISQSSASLSGMIHVQAAMSDEIGESVSDLTASIGVVANSTKEASGLASNTVAIAEAGGETVTRSVEAMAEIDHSSEQINEITQVISEIASQTNLLALNAAIEAARAGEHGAGFAVVADEVRKLAERSSEAAKQITVLIRDSGRRVEEGANLSRETGEALKQIVESIQQTAAAIGGIVDATDRQFSTASEVTDAIQAGASLTSGNLDSCKQMTESGGELESLVSGLRAIVEQFQVDEQASPEVIIPTGG